MEIRQLQNQIRTLIELDETDSPIVSYFLDCEDPDAPQVLRERAIAARKAVDRSQREDLERTLDRIENHVTGELGASTRSVAIFARSGSSPLFTALEFEATLPTQMFVDPLPTIFPLVQLKDNYHRYVLMICNEESARILEVSLGSVTREVWARRPELRERVGREWTKLHYQNHRRDRSERFVKEKIALLERIFASGGHSHLMLAGNTQILARVRKALPKALADRLVDAVPASSRDRSTDVVVATLSSFLEHEERESQAAVGLLRRELRRGGLATCGYRDSRAALERGQADLLVLLADEAEAAGSQAEELVRLAVQADVHVEVVQDSDELEALGGVGCLLRYETWDEPLHAAEDAA